MLVLPIWPYGQQAKVPDGILFRLQPDRSKQRPIGFVAPNEEMRLGIRREVLSQERLIEPLAFDDPFLGVPARLRSRRAIGDVGKRNNFREVTFFRIP